MLQLRDPGEDFRVSSIAQLAKGGRWRVEAMRSYSRPMLLWFTRGQGRITIAGRARGFGPHTLVFLPPRTMHGFAMMGTVSGTVVRFPVSAATDLPDAPIHARLHRVAEQAEVTGLVDALSRETASERADAERAARLHGGLLALWLERFAAGQADAAAEARTPGQTAEELASAFTAMVEQDFRSGKGVAHYAAALGVTPTHLSRTCRKTCGRSASKILADRIHYEARRMLADSDVPVKEIARSLGFRSAAYFTRAFQSNVGTTPSAFRNTG